MQSYYSITDCIPYTVHYIPRSYFLWSWKFVPLNPLYLFCPTLYLLPSRDHWFVICLHGSIYVFCLFARYSATGRKHVVLIFSKWLLPVEEEVLSLAHSTPTSKGSVTLFLHSLVPPPRPGIEMLEPEEAKTLACCQSLHDSICEDMLLRAYFGINYTLQLLQRGKVWAPGREPHAWLKGRK